VFVFLGANQSKVPFEFATALQSLGTNAEYVKIDGSGSNALDFHIAYHVGRLAEIDPSGYFHIVSKDTGFDPLIKHLKARKVLAQRSRELSEIFFLRISNAKSVEEKIQAIAKSLAARGQARPRKVKTLANTINALFLKTLEEAELLKLIDEMKSRKLIVVENESVSYLPPISQS
jgi:hypothetical protein